MNADSSVFRKIKSSERLREKSGSHRCRLLRYCFRCELNWYHHITNQGRTLSCAQNTTAGFGVDSHTSHRWLRWCRHASLFS